MSDVEIIDCKQGDPEWDNARAGVITASKFGMVRAKVNTLDEKQAAFVSAILEGKSERLAMSIADYKAPPKSTRVALAIEKGTLDVGDWSEKAMDYAFRLACERINGGPLPDDQFETFAMKRGRELEEACRRRHEKDIADSVQLAGFVRTKDGKFGFSADALVDDVGGAEYKCFYGPSSVRPIVLGGDWGDVKDQVQGSLWIGGGKWWDQCLYVPFLKNVGKDFLRQRTERDEAHIEAMELDLLAFDQVVTKIEIQLRA